MESLKMDVEKICSFYVNEWHLVTMVLPYINKEINEKANITTILENDIEENVKTLLAKLNLKNEKTILEINWKANKEITSNYIEDIFNNLIKNNDNEEIIFINGSRDYIDFANYQIEKMIKQNIFNIKDKKIKIINCYEVTEFNSGIKDILDSHIKILNTAGEKYITEVFGGYERKMA